MSKTDFSYLFDGLDDGPRGKIDSDRRLNPDGSKWSRNDGGHRRQENGAPRWLQHIQGKLGAENTSTKPTNVTRNPCYSMGGSLPSSVPAPADAMRNARVSTPDGEQVPSVAVGALVSGHLEDPQRVTAESKAKAAMDMSSCPAVGIDKEQPTVCPLTGAAIMPAAWPPEASLDIPQNDRGGLGAESVLPLPRVECSVCVEKPTSAPLTSSSATRDIQFKPPQREQPIGSTTTREKNSPAQVQTVMDSTRNDSLEGLQKWSPKSRGQGFGQAPKAGLPWRISSNPGFGFSSVERGLRSKGNDMYSQSRVDTRCVCPPTSRRVVVLRHGSRPEGVDPPLDGLGHKQAARVARFLAGAFRGQPGTPAYLSCIFCSPFTRALQTADPVASSLKLPVCVEWGFSELLAHGWLQGGDPFPILRQRSPSQLPARAHIDESYESAVVPEYPDVSGPLTARDDEKRRRPLERHRRAIQEVLKRAEGVSLLVIAHGSTHDFVVDALCPRLHPRSNRTPFCVPDCGITEIVADSQGNWRPLSFGSKPWATLGFC